MSMTQEDKKLLLRDLSARLPYGVKITTTNPAVKIGVISGISIKNKISVETKHATIVFDCTEVRPYLRPMDSMTKKETKELFKEIGFEFTCNTCGIPAHYNYEFAEQIKGIPTITNVEFIKVVDWLSAHHFDYRGLIEKGLAIAVTKENNPYK